MPVANKLSSSPELATVRLTAEVAGIASLALSIWRWVESGSFTHAVEPLLPFFGWTALALWFLVGASWLVLGTGRERLVSLIALLPVGYVLAGGSVRGLGMLALLVSCLWVVGALVSLVGHARQRTEADP